MHFLINVYTNLLGTSIIEKYTINTPKDSADIKYKYFNDFIK